MSLLSKLTGGNKNVEKAAKDLLSGLLGNAQQNRPAETRAASPAASKTDRTSPKSSAPSGFSWGETMPDEENQFNYNGPFASYFENIFRAEFPEYRLEKETVNGGKRVIFTFFDGGRKALVVELLGQSSAVKKLRRDCAAAGIPYLRYYYDHDGWWNTRSYVVTRTRKALGGN